MDNKVEELVTFLKQPPREIKVATLPDFFLDRLISFECGSEDFSKALENITKRKGGSIDGVSQVNQQGGNAVNVALALAMLGVKVAPIVCTSRQGMELLRFYLEPRGVDLSHVKILKKASITTALEFRNGKEKVNVWDDTLAEFADVIFLHIDNYNRFLLRMHILHCIASFQETALLLY